MATFILEPATSQEASAPQPSGYEDLGAEVLLRNAIWFTRIRWTVVGALTAFGAGSLGAPELLTHFGLVAPRLWPWAMAIVLTVMNLLIIVWLRRLRRRPPGSLITVNMWIQIVADLAVLTVLVYLVGPTDTVIAFAYLFHIALACIFFGRRDSFLVTLLSVCFFLATVVAVCFGILPRHSILASGSSTAPDLLTAATFTGPTVFVWFVVWYLVSSISDVLRQRDNELDLANKQLLRADEEKNMHVLRVTHDLKAPFAGIENNIQVLRQIHWEEITENVRQIIGKIEARSATLRARIGDILMLGDLRSPSALQASAERVNLRDLLSAVLQEVQGMAAQKHITVEGTPEEVFARGNTRQLRILFLNLLSNAILYSHEGGTVTISVKEGKQAAVRIVDHGIGISEKALPRIFEDFFRTKEAADFNPMSTGLGLAIVRQVARNLRLTIIVNSEEGKGTTFDVLIPTDQKENV